jgi:hypothetical protein
MKHIYCLYRFNWRFKRMVRPKTTTGDLVPITTYVDEDTFQRIETVRGKVPRSAFISDVLSELLEEVPLDVPKA